MNSKIRAYEAALTRCGVDASKIGADSSAEGGAAAQRPPQGGQAGAAAVDGEGPPSPEQPPSRPAEPPSEPFDDQAGMPKDEKRHKGAGHASPGRV